MSASTCFYSLCAWLLYFAWVVDDAKCIVVTSVCVFVCLSVCVCLSAAACPHYCTDPDVTWDSGRECPIVVHYWADLQSVHGLHCCGNITRTLVKACVHPAIWRHSANARQGLRALLAGDWQVMGGILKIEQRIWEVAVAGWLVTGRRRAGRSQHYCGGLGCGLPLLAFWQHFANTKCQRVHACTRCMPSCSSASEWVSDFYW